MFCVFLCGPFCHGAHKLDLSTLFTTCFSLNVSSIYINQYVVSDVPISPSAERTTKICMRNQTEMLVNGQPVNSVGIRQALGDFISWLKMFNNVVLVAHNGRIFIPPQQNVGGGAILSYTIKMEKIFNLGSVAHVSVQCQGHN